MTRVDLVAFDAMLRRHRLPSYCSACRPEYPPIRSHGSGQALLHHIRWACGEEMTKSLELTDKLDAPASPVVNGPEDDVLDWLSVDWQTVEDDVRRLRQRIFTASRNGDLAKVRNLQKLDAPVTSQRSYERAAGDRAQHRPQDGGHRPAGGGDCARQGLVGQPGAAPRRLLGAQARQAGVHPEVQRETAPARDTRDLSTGLSKPRWSMLSNPSGRHASSRSPMAFDPVGAAMTPSRPSSTPLRANTPSGCWVLDADLAAAFDRIDHSHLLGRPRQLPRQGTGRAVAESWRGRTRVGSPRPRREPHKAGSSPPCC